MRLSLNDFDEIKTTRPEKFLAIILVVFMMIGSIWAYTNPLNRVQDNYQSQPSYSNSVNCEGPNQSLDQIQCKYPTASPQEKQYLISRDQAQKKVGLESESVATAKAQVETAREAYRTQLDAGNKAPDLAGAYAKAQQELASVRLRLDAAQAELDKASGPAKKAEQQIVKMQKQVERRQAKQNKSQEVVTFFLRAGYLLALLGIGFVWFQKTARSNSRWLIVAMAFLAHATLMTFGFSIDYLGRYINWQDIGPLVLSLVGIALTILAFVAYQRFLTKRVPLRRVRKRECPQCGYAVLDGPHCEGCGFLAIDACHVCKHPRRVMSPYCASCGKK